MFGGWRLVSGEGVWCGCAVWALLCSGVFVSWGAVVCLKAWGLICEYRKEFGKYPRNLREPKHLLWALYFIKVYNTNKCCETWADATYKTFRSRAWDILEQLSDIALLKVSKTFFEKNKIRTTYPTLLFLSNSNSNDFSFL